MKRRDFFKWLGGLAGAALLPKLPDVSAEVDPYEGWYEGDVSTETPAEIFSDWTEPAVTSPQVLLTWRGDTWDLTEAVISIDHNRPFADVTTRNDLVKCYAVGGPDTLSLNLKPNDLDSLKMLGETVRLQIFFRPYEPGCPVFEGEYLLRSVSGYTLELEALNGDYAPQWATWTEPIYATSTGGDTEWYLVADGTRIIHKR